MNPGSVQPDRLLKQLDEVWAELSRAHQADALVRACSMTLLVVTTSPDDDVELKNTLSELMGSHPARMIIIRIVDAPDPRLEASVSAQCVLAFGRRDQICCEMIEIRATRDRLFDVYAASLGLTVADLPVILWIKDLTLLQESRFSPMLQLARTLLVDTAALGASALPSLEELKEAGWRVKDLAWTRCTAWRETLAQSFENECLRERISDITDVEIAHAGEHPLVSGLYLRSWLSSVIPQARFAFVPAEARRNGNLQSLRFLAPTHRLELRAVDDSTLEVITDTLVTRVQAPARAEANLLAEELSILGVDPVYEATLAATAASPHLR